MSTPDYTPPFVANPRIIANSRAIAELGRPSSEVGPWILATPNRQIPGFRKIGGMRAPRRAGLEELASSRCLAKPFFGVVRTTHPPDLDGTSGDSAIG